MLFSPGTKGVVSAERLPASSSSAPVGKVGKGRGPHSRGLPGFSTAVVPSPLKPFRHVAGKVPASKRLQGLVWIIKFQAILYPQLPNDGVCVGVCMRYIALCAPDSWLFWKNTSSSKVKFEKPAGKVPVSRR